MSECFVLLDDAQADSSRPRSRLYSEYLNTLICSDPCLLPQFLEAVQQELEQGRFVVTLFSYELGAAFHNITPRSDNAALPAQALIFQDCHILSAEQVAHWLGEQMNGGQDFSGVADVQSASSYAQFNEALTKIAQYIKEGDTYQVNYTFPLHFKMFGNPFSLYSRLRARQKVSYGALIRLPDHGLIVSLSPELFLQHVDGQLTAQPMKGTLRVLPSERLEDAQKLAQDPKNQAENVMIVDLLRNDLGQIAETGSVKVPQLFEVKQYGDVWQMTSTITARLREGKSLYDIFYALFPCGSITGAPKHRAMQIIRELESQARGLYTGAMGWFDPPSVRGDLRLGNFCLSVPIRTLTLPPPTIDGTRLGTLGIGAGITHDSDSKKEYAECLLKAQFLTHLPQEFQLFETMLLTPAGYPYLEQHVRRLKNSALYFGFQYDEQALRNSLQSVSVQQPKGTYRVRLSLSYSGAHQTQCVPLVALKEPVKLLIAPQPVDTPFLFLAHKTTVRTAYDEAWHYAETQGAFDMIFTNAQGALTEGARSNLFIQLDNQWVTPPLEEGVLPGVMRDCLLKDVSWNVQERRLTLEDLFRAQKIIVCNAVRGILEARVVTLSPD